MRTVVLLLLTCALAWGVWTLLGTEEAWVPDALPEDPPAESSPPPPPPGTGVALYSGVLSIKVRTSHGEAPPETTAGYRRGNGERVRAIDENGQVRFSDAPLGEVIVVAHAPGYEDGTRATYISAGVPVDLVIVLVSRHGDGPVPKDDEEEEKPPPEAVK